MKAKMIAPRCVPLTLTLSVLLTLGGLLTLAPWSPVAAQGDPVADQNLFSPSRAPIKPPPPQPAVRSIPPPPRPEPPPPTFSLSGVLIVEGVAPVAFVQEPRLTQGQSVSLKPGDELGGYRLARIAEDQVVFEKGEQRLTVRLSDPKRAAMPAVAGAPVALPRALAAQPAIQPGAPGTGQVSIQPGRPTSRDRRAQRAERFQRRRGGAERAPSPLETIGGDDDGEDMDPGLAPEPRPRRNPKSGSPSGQVTPRPSRSFADALQGAIQRQGSGQ